MKKVNNRATIVGTRNCFTGDTNAAIFLCLCSSDPISNDGPLK